MARMMRPGSMGVSLRIAGTVVAALLVQSCVIPYPVSWTEMALLHDGREIAVERTVMTGHTGTDLSEAFHRGFISHSISFRHPDTKKKIRWEGEDFVDPHAIEVVDGVVILVVVVHRRSTQYGYRGCVDFPYVAFRFVGHWEEIPMADLPREVTTANLLIDPQGRKPEYHLEDDPVLNVRQIAEMNAFKRDGTFAEFVIPRDISEWRYKYKGSTNDLYRCRAGA